MKRKNKITSTINDLDNYLILSIKKKNTTQKKYKDTKNKAEVHNY